MDRLQAISTTILSLLVLFTFTFLVSCDSSSDGDELDEEAQFVATWNVTAVDIEAMIGDETLAEYLVSQGLADTQAEAEAFVTLFFTGPFEQELLGGTIVFRADNTYTATFDGDDPEVGTWSYNASTGIITIDADEPGIEDIEVKVVSISGNTLVVEQQETEEDDINGDGTPETIEVVIQMTFTKV